MKGASGSNCGGHHGWDLHERDLAGSGGGPQEHGEQQRQFLHMEMAK